QAICTVVSVWAYASRTVRFQIFCTCSMISGFSGSPAEQTSRSAVLHDCMSSCTNMRHTVGGAQSVVILFAAIARSISRALKRGWLAMNTVAPAFQGAKKQLYACFAQPGDEMLRCMSPSCRPSQYIVIRCPTGPDSSDDYAPPVWDGRWYQR